MFTIYDRILDVLHQSKKNYLKHNYSYISILLQDISIRRVLHINSVSNS